MGLQFQKITSVLHSSQRAKLSNPGQKLLTSAIGGTLPLLRNRDELNEIITFLKLSEDMPPVEGLYIGIQRSFKSEVTHRVNSNELTDCCLYYACGHY